jgi:hypothetical protein
LAWVALVAMVAIIAVPIVMVVVVGSSAEGLDGVAGVAIGLETLLDCKAAVLLSTAPMLQDAARGMGSDGAQIAPLLCLAPIASMT